MASPYNPHTLVEPTDAERTAYFHGLAGGRLVARTNCHEKRWGSYPTTIRGPVGGREPRVKLFVAVGSLTACAEYDKQAAKKLKQVSADIVSALRGVNWTWFTGIRIGYSDVDLNRSQEDRIREFPLVLYLTVAFGTTFTDVSPAVLAVKQILARGDLPEVHVEVHENILVNNAATPGLERTVEGLHVPGGAFLDTRDWGFRYYEPYMGVGGSMLGWPISKTGPNLSDSLYGGTTGPFITFEEKPGKIYTTTCRHVVLPDSATHNIEDRHHDGCLRQGGDAALRDKLKRAEWCLRTANPGEHPFRTSIVAELTDALEQGAHKRCIGRVYVLAGAEVQNDWALVKLDKTCFEEARNMVYLGTAGTEALTETSFTGSLRGTTDMTIDEDNLITDKIRDTKAFLCLDGTHLERRATLNRIPVVRVVKRGAPYGLAFGLTNGIEAVVRYPLNKGNSEASTGYCWQILVIPLHPIDQYAPRMTFSGPGDSGATVIDVNGRFIGHCVSSGPSAHVRGYRTGALSNDDSGVNEPLSPEAQQHFRPGHELTMVAPAWAVLGAIERATEMTPIIARPKFDPSVADTKI